MCDYFNTPPQQRYAAINVTFSFDGGTFLAGGHYCKTCRVCGVTPAPPPPPGPATKRWRTNLF